MRIYRHRIVIDSICLIEFAACVHLYTVLNDLSNFFLLSNNCFLTKTFCFCFQHNVLFITMQTEFLLTILNLTPSIHTFSFFSKQHYAENNDTLDTFGYHLSTVLATTFMILYSFVVASGYILQTKQCPLVWILQTEFRICSDKLPFPILFLVICCVSSKTKSNILWIY